jgi:hypothetical protein
MHDIVKFGSTFSVSGKTYSLDDGEVRDAGFGSDWNDCRVRSFVTSETHIEVRDAGQLLLAWPVAEIIWADPDPQRQWRKERPLGVTLDAFKRALKEAIADERQPVVKKSRTANPVKVPKITKNKMAKPQKRKLILAAGVKYPIYN